MAVVALAQGISTTTVQGTVYLANGSPGSGTLQLSWPAFTTALARRSLPARSPRLSARMDSVSVNLAPNLGSSPAGLYYTAIYHMSDGTTSTEYWVVPAAAQASIAQVRSQVMPAAQAVQAVSKAYVDQAIQSVAQGNLTSTGGQLTGPLYLTGDPGTIVAGRRQALCRLLVCAGRAPVRRVRQWPAHRAAAGRRIPGRPVFRSGLRREAAGLLSNHQRHLRGHLRRAQLQRHSCDGREPDHLHCEHHGDAALRNHLHGEPDHRYSRVRAMCPCAAAHCAERATPAAARAARCCSIRVPAAAIQVGDRTYAADTHRLSSRQCGHQHHGLKQSAARRHSQRIARRRWISRACICWAMPTRPA